jgi:catechol 2,3-dioxygenase-like lactoylglutathione lyase family enzyme
VDCLRSVIAAADPGLLAPALAARVRFGSCIGRPQVLQYLNHVVRRPPPASVEIDARADRLILILEPERSGLPESLRDADWRVAVLFVRDGEIVELQIAADRAAALTASMTPPPAPWSGTRTALTGIASVLAVRDLARALEHYRRLGFCVGKHGEGAYGFAERDGLSLHFRVVPDLEPARTTSAVYFYVDDADSLFAEWAAAGVNGQFFEPDDTDYGLREGAHIDLDGNLLRFGSPSEREA